MQQELQQASLVIRPEKWEVEAQTGRPREEGGGRGAERAG
jgi:hypothetical protein